MNWPPRPTRPRSSSIRKCSSTTAVSACCWKSAPWRSAPSITITWPSSTPRAAAPSWPYSICARPSKRDSKKRTSWRRIRNSRLCAIPTNSSNCWPRIRVFCDSRMSLRRSFVRLVPFLFLAACGPKTPPGPEHIAILRFENLSPDASSDWMGRAFSEIIAAELPNTLAIPSARLHSFDRTLAPRPVSAPGISTERTEAILAGANRIAYGDYTVRNGRIEARLTIEDPQTGRVVRVLSATGREIVQAATGLAHDLSPSAAAYDTRSPDAVKAYVVAMEAGDPASIVRNAEAAVAADPDFAQAYRLLADAKAQANDRAGAVEVLDKALARGAAISAVEHAR